MYFTYIIKSIITGNFYIGFTEDLEKRLEYHNIGLNKSTRNKGPWKLVYKEKYTNKSDAIKRERFLKKQRNTEFYNRLIANGT